MGTNYFAIPKATDSLKIKIIQAVLNNQMSEVRRLTPQQIHIGKASGGWPFLFNHNNWEYYDSADKLVEFLDDCDVVDEYGRHEDVKSFKEYLLRQKNFELNKFTNSQHSHCYIIKDGYGFSTSTEFF